jgi:divalent metal cation (Fe/Co/Zn/Cd) transporter
MRYRILSILAVVAMFGCGIYILMYRFEHPYRRVLKIISHRWLILLGILLFGLLAVIFWHRYFRQREAKVHEDEVDEGKSGGIEKGDI